MSDEKLQSIQPAEGPQCSFEGQVCLPPEAFYDDEEQLCIDPGNTAAEYQEAEKSKIANLDHKKALANKAKSFAEKPKIKKEEKKEVAPPIFKAVELSPSPGGCVDATPATAPAPLVLFSANLNLLGALFYLQDQEPVKVEKKKDRAVGPENQPIEVASNNSDLARAMIREGREAEPVPTVQASELFFAENRQNISGGEAFPPILDVLKAEIVSPKPEAVSEKKESEKKEGEKGRQIQTVAFVSQDGVLSVPEISLPRQVMETSPSPSTAQTSINIIRQFFVADPAVSGLLVFPFALPFKMRGVVALNGPGIKLAFFTRVNPGSSAHGQQGRQGSRQGKGGQRSFQ